MSCGGKQLWYVCSKGNFRGCCSVDPCNTGVCPDSSGGDYGGGADTTSASTTTLIMSPTSQDSKTASSTTRTSSLSPTEIITGISTATYSTPSPSSSNASVIPDAGSNNNKGLIGGVIGGVLGLVLLVVLVIIFLCRSRKKRARRFRLVQWHGPQYNHGINHYEKDHEKDSDPDPDAGTIAGSSAGTRSGDDVHLQVQVPGVGVGFKEGSQGSYNTNSYNGHTPSTRAETPDSATRLLTQTSPSISSSPEKQPHPHYLHQSFTRSILASPPLPSPPMRSLDATPPSVTRIPTPELGDTGFYRQRAELPTTSHSELINIPYGERTRRNQNHETQAQPQNQPNHHERTPIATESANSKTQIITPDGAVLAANFERSPACHDYATSFMESYDGYDGVKLGLGMGLEIRFEDELPAYYPVDGDVDAADIGKKGDGCGNI